MSAQADVAALYGACADAAARVALDEAWARFRGFTLPGRYDDNDLGVARVAEEDCPGHVASDVDAKICARCGVHIDSLRPDNDSQGAMPF